MKVTIHGAGVAGLSTALALHRAGHDAAVLDGGTSRSGDGLEVVGEEFLALLADMGVPDLLSRLCRNVAIETIVTDWPGSGELAWAAGFRPIERRWALARPEVEDALRRTTLAHGVTVTPADRRKLRTGAEDLIVDATGAAATLARRIGGKRVMISGLIAISVPAFAAPSSQPIVEAGTDGWWFAVGQGSQWVATYFTGADVAARILTPEHFAARLACTTSLGKHVTVDRLAPLSRRLAASSFLDPVATARWAAVGDAALTHDPLASQGMTFAVQSAYALRDACATGEFRVDKYKRVIDLKIARYRVARQRIYLSGAEFFQTQFWQDRAQLTLPAK